MDMRIHPCPNLQLVTISFLLLVPLYHGADSITGGQSLTGDQTIESKGGTFVLGFFKPGNSNNFYIGMWYKEVSERTPVWVANRDSPVSDKYSSFLKLLDGNLVIMSNGSKTPVWSTNLTTTAASSKSTEAALLDNGNFVLRDSPNSTQFIWQSFDHPTDTWLPGSKLSLNKKTKTPQLLTAWKNSADPATGLFSLELSPNGTREYLILWNKSVQYWTSGSWDDQQKTFSLVPEMRLNYIYNFSFVDNENESYFTYSVYDTSIISRFIMDVSGQIKQLTWLKPSQQWNLFWSQPRQQCEVYAFCGAFGTCNQNSQTSCDCLIGFSPKSQSDWDLNDYSRGCARNTKLNCGNGTKTREDTDRFWPYQDMGLPKDPDTVTTAAAGTSQENCQAACLKNCSCTAYTYSSSGCSIWTGDLLDLKQLSDGDKSGKNLYLRLAASEFPSNSKKKKVVAAIVGSVAGVLLLVLLCIVLAIYRRNKRRSSCKTTMEGSLIAFAYKDLQNATKNFSEKLGGGGFGSVFKGTLPDSSVIAVKKLESVSQGEKQFRTEVSTIGTIQHLNLVRLRGFCSEGTSRLLVYDYMPNGSLETHLFRERSSGFLEWEARYGIALGTARGLAYLHEKCRDCIIHCDIKPENILLDAEFCPKVADFGLAKLIGREFSRVLTTMRGTRGYLAPEWISGVAITAKADVYSYGMMLFEILSGRRNTEQSDDGKVKFFPSWAAIQIITAGEDILSILDKRLEEKADREEAMKICKLACWCIQDDENQRPSMGQVVQILEGVLDVNMPPIPRSLQLFVDNQENIVFFTESSSSQSTNTRSNTSTASSQTKSNTSNSSPQTRSNTSNSSPQTNNNSSTQQ